MNPVPLISRADLEKRLSPYKCKCLAKVTEDAELWETGWGYPFTLWSQSGYYEYWQYTRILAHVIAKTMPPGWKAENGG